MGIQPRDSLKPFSHFFHHFDVRGQKLEAMVQNYESSFTTLVTKVNIKHRTLEVVSDLKTLMYTGAVELSRSSTRYLILCFRSR